MRNRGDGKHCKAHLLHFGSACQRGNPRVTEAVDSTVICLAAGPPGIEPADNDGRPPSAWQRVKRFFGGDKLDRKRIAALGVGAVLSYGFVSNVTYGGGMAIAWIAFVKQRGLSPLMPGQWKAFLAYYAGAGFDFPFTNDYAVKFNC